jgi:hypothetical protein
MDQFEYPSTGNVILLEGKLKDGGRENGCPIDGEAGGTDDPRMKEAMVLMKAFLAIEDQAGRNALVTLAQQIVSHEWARRATQR